MRPSSTITLSVCVLAAGALSALMATPSQAAPPIPDGLYEGRERAPRGPGRPVSVELRDGGLVLMESARVIVGRAELKLTSDPQRSGPSEVFEFAGTWEITGALHRSGTPAGVRRHKGKAALELEADRALLCLSEAGFAGETLRPPRGGRAPEPRVRCFDLGRTPLRALSAPVPPGPDAAFTACFRRCVEDNRARASNAATLDNECERQCRAAPTTPGALKRP